MNSETHSLVVGVNYNSDESALDFIRSLKEISSPQNVTIILVDNTDREDSSEFFDRVWNVCPEVRCVKPPKNLGYFGGAYFGLIEYLKKFDYPDWVIVSNVDIEFKDSAFFEYLHSINPDTNDIGVIAPSIWTEFYKTDRNPHMLERLPYAKIQLYKKLYRFYPVMFIYFFVARIKYFLKNRVFSKSAYLPTPWSQISESGVNVSPNPNGNTSNDVKIIYAPQGSCIIFSKRYFTNGGTLNYPSFLFQEEIFVAEETRIAGLKIVYNPRLQVSHKGHVSTGYILSPRMARYFYASTGKIAELYYSE